MLENSLWLRYNPEKTIRDVLTRIYECDAVEIEEDERELYASLKRHLTKKELKIVMMNEAGLSSDAIAHEVGSTVEELKLAHHKAYRKIRQEKIRQEVRANKITKVTQSDDEA
ncbi:MAG: hypothetical protein WA080_06600 [Sulfuricurvum sp.]|jgi:DNA-directed RNA polymerase specialized sigma24 family protein